MPSCDNKLLIGRVLLVPGWTTVTPILLIATDATTIISAKHTNKIKGSGSLFPIASTLPNSLSRKVVGYDFLLFCLQIRLCHAFSPFPFRIFLDFFPFNYQKKIY